MDKTTLLVKTLTRPFHPFWPPLYIDEVDKNISEQGSVRRLTHWEQLDHGEQYTPTRTFLTIIPILLFFLASFYSSYEPTHFAINFVSLMFVLIPKHHTFHRKRLFGINKY